MRNEKVLNEKFCNQTPLNKEGQSDSSNSPICGWELLDKQSQRKFEAIIELIFTKNIKEIKLKIDGSSIKKGYAIEKDRKFDSNARVSDYLKSNSKLSLNFTNDGVFGTKEIFF
ncbi:hypothetical protein HGH92_10640 [Chitinophaga varians]|uniref:Uncharacterized protein n=1 Tax=Chitinophaga varians TaxID=2202339 RepID=A0A847RPA3_9BACT|nr:hypothetical protein [Chitinophaga varians]NLR64762.1 hypothetical protein [Chitinophaga varians]